MGAPEAVAGFCVSRSTRSRNFGRVASARSRDSACDSPPAAREPVICEFRAALGEQPHGMVKIKVIPINCRGFQVTARFARRYLRDALPIRSSLGEQLAVGVNVPDASEILRVPRICRQEMLFDF